MSRALRGAAARVLVTLLAAIWARAGLGAPARTSGPAPAAIAPQFLQITPLDHPRADTLFWSYELRRYARASEQRPQVPLSPALADSCWSKVLMLPNIWQWEAAQHLANHALAAGDTARADSILGATRDSEWPPSERAERLVRLASRDSAHGDHAAAMRGCRRVIRTYPSLPAARIALAILDSLSGDGPDSLTIEDQRLGAEVEFWSGARDAAILRLGRAFASRAGGSDLRLGLRLAEMQRLARRWADARRTLLACRRLKLDAEERSRVWLERARLLRDTGSPDSAYHAYAQTAALAGDRTIVETAWWETAREAEEGATWAVAGPGYARVEKLGMRRASEARLRLGLHAWGSGRPSRARRWLARAGGEGGTFWWAAAARESSASAADSALRILASSPGYTFYRVVARESLGVRGWPDSLSGRRMFPVVTGFFAWLRPVRGELVPSAESANDAAAILNRWAADDARAGAPPDGAGRHPTLLLAASDLLRSYGRPADAIRLAQRAAASLADSSDAMQWAVWPSIYPRDFGASIDSALAAVSSQVDPNLMRALIWKESHFDSNAVSRVGALGLTQLMPRTAFDMALHFGDPRPPENALASPRLNIRYGARHLKELLDRLDGRVPLALAAYNAGLPATQRWAGLAAGADDALLCERIAYTETQDYVKSILAAREAYRELPARPVR